MASSQNSLTPYFIYGEGTITTDTAVCQIEPDTQSEDFLVRVCVQGEGKYQSESCSASAVIAHLAELAEAHPEGFIIQLSYQTAEKLNPALNEWYQSLLIKRTLGCVLFRKLKR